MNKWIEILVCFLIFVLLFIGFYMLFRSVTIINSARKNMEKIYFKLHEQNEIRVSQLELERRMYGTASANPDKKTNILERFLQRIDDVLIYSGMSIRHIWLNTSTYIVLSVLGGALIALIAMALWGNVLVTVLLSLSGVLIPYIYMVIHCDKNYKDTEKQLIYFINVIANNSLVTNNVVSVLDSTAKYANEPIKGAVNRALAASKLSENKENSINVCIEQLTREIEHPMFVRFIRNLEICSRNNADYRSVARDFSKQAQSAIETLEKQRAMFANIRNLCLMMYVIGMMMISSACDEAEVGLFKVVQDLMETPIGILFLAIECLVIGGTAIYLLIGSRR